MSAMAKGESRIIKHNVSLFRRIPAWTMVVDPGEEHCGIVLTAKTPPAPRIGDLYSRFYFAITVTPDEGWDRAARFLLDARRAGRTGRLIIEEYRIYPDKAMMHSGKRVPTAEHIGGFKVLARRIGGEVIECPAYVKQTTEGMLRAKGIALLGGTQHARDAEVIMWYHILNEGQGAAVGN